MGEYLNLVDEIDAYLTRKQEAKERERHYPSDATSCLRKLYYKWTQVGESNPTDAGGFWKMEMGNAMHTLIQEFLTNAGFAIEHEVKGRKQIPGLQYEVSYRLDSVFMEAPKGSDGLRRAGVEIKSSYGRGIVAIAKEQKPKESDLSQICLYMNLENIPRFYLIYLGRDNGYRCQFIVEYKDGVLCANGIPFPDITYDKLIGRFAMLENYLDAKALPERDYRVAIKGGEIKDRFQKDKVIYKTDWQCSYCQFKDKCWAEVLSNYRENDNRDMFGGVV